MEAFQLAERSFCNEVSYIQSNVKKDVFVDLIPKAVEDFEFDLIVAVKVKTTDIKFSLKKKKKKKNVQEYSTVVHIEVKAHPVVKEYFNVDTLR